MPECVDLRHTLFEDVRLPSDPQACFSCAGEAAGGGVQRGGGAVHHQRPRGCGAGCRCRRRACRPGDCSCAQVVNNVTSPLILSPCSHAIVFSPECITADHRWRTPACSVTCTRPPPVLQGDLPAAEARALLGPHRVLGVSVKTPEQAIAAAAAGADYLGAGAGFRLFLFFFC